MTRFLCAVNSIMASREEQILNRENVRNARLAQATRERNQNARRASLRSNTTNQRRSVERNNPPPQNNNEINLGNDSEIDSENTSLTASTQYFNTNQLAAIVQALQPILPPQREQTQTPNFNIKPYGTVIDTNTKQGTELYSQAIKRFDPLYDGSQEHLHAYVDKVRQRAGHLNCIEIFDIPTQSDSGNETKMNIFDDYNSLTLQETYQTATARWSTNNWEK